MFASEEKLKPMLLANLPPESSLHFALDRYWPQLELYLLNGPLKWMHLWYWLYGVDWDSHYLIVKPFILIYMVLVLIGWEFGRIVMVHAYNAVARGETGHFVGNIVSGVTEFAAHAKPTALKLYEMALDLFQQAKEAVLKLYNGQGQAGN